MRLWYLAFDGQPRGPLTEQAMRAYAAQGTAQAASLAWTPGMESWAPLGAVVAWLDAQPATPAPAPTAVLPEPEPVKRSVVIRTRVAARVFGVLVLVGALGVAARMEAESPASAAARQAGTAPVATASAPAEAPPLDVPKGADESDRILRGLQDHFSEGWSTPVGIDVVTRLHDAGHFRVQYTTVDKDQPVSGCVNVRYRGGALDHKTSWETLARC